MNQTCLQSINQLGKHICSKGNNYRVIYFIFTTSADSLRDDVWFCFTKSFVWTEFRKRSLNYFNPWSCQDLQSRLNTTSIISSSSFKLIVCFILYCTVWTHCVALRPLGQTTFIKEMCCLNKGLICLNKGFIHWHLKLSATHAAFSVLSSWGDESVSTKTAMEICIIAHFYI